MLGKVKQELLCHMCGMPGHTRKQCDRQHQNDKGKAAGQLYGENVRPNRRVNNNVILASAESCLLNSISPSPWRSKSRWPCWPTICNSFKQHSQKFGARMLILRPAPTLILRGGFMAHACDLHQWLPTSPSPYGFALDDSYPSEEGSGMLATNPHKRCVRHGFTPLRLVPAANVGRVIRVRPQPAHAPPPRPVPTSARRQELIREPPHNE
jgi:hypothetical protein